MTLIRVVNRTRGSMLGSRVRLADGLASRSRGFLFRPRPAPGEGILLSPCRAVHMFGVRFPLDVVFISEGGLVVAVYPELAPWRRSRMHGAALHALELPPGTIEATGTAVGDALSWTAAEGDLDVVELMAAAADNGRTPDSGSAAEDEVGAGDEATGVVTVETTEAAGQPARRRA